MPPAQPPYAAPAKRLDAISYRVIAFWGPLVERLRSPTTSSRPTVNVPFSPYGYRPPRSPYSLGSIPLRAIRPFAPDTHRRSTGESALPTSPFRCNFNASLNRKQGTGTQQIRSLLTASQGQPNFDARQRQTVIQAYRPASNLRGSYV